MAALLPAFSFCTCSMEAKYFKEKMQLRGITKKQAEDLYEFICENGNKFPMPLSDTDRRIKKNLIDFKIKLEKFI